MSECSICGEFSECLHPADFVNDPENPECPEEIKQYMGIGCALDDLDAADAAEEFWEKCARLCHECFRKYIAWISWWG